MKTMHLKKSWKWIILPISVAGMGITMPSCPGQQAMQQQIDSLQTTNQDLNKKIQALTLQVNSLNSDMNQVKQLMPQITSLLTAEKTALEQLDATVKDLQGKTAKLLSKKKGR